ncbi:hypothetical protein GCM10027038_05950 [Arthrobacter bambusae]
MAGGREAFRRRDNIKADRAAEATVLQDGLCPLHQFAVAENPPQNDGTVQEVVQDHHRIAVGPPKPGGGCFAALAVQ